MLHLLDFTCADIVSYTFDEPIIVISWESELNFIGTFKPGHYRYQRRLFTHFRVHTH